jgi:hypothetical protein
MPAGKLCVRARRLVGGNGDGVFIAEQRLHGVGRGAELEPGHVLEANHFARGASLDDDVAEFFLVLEAALGIQRDLEFRAFRGRCADLAGGHLHVLFADGGDHVAGSQIARGEFLRIEPHAHGVVAGAEHPDITHAGETSECVADVQRGVVAKIETVVAAIGRGEMHHHEKGRAALERGHAELAHFLGEPWQRLRDAVLHLHLRLVDVGADAEGHGERERAVERGLRGHVQHVFDAHDLLLERRGHCFRDHLGIGAGVGGAHHHRRRHDFRVFADR